MNFVLENDRCMEKLILKFELDRKQMISANDRLHFQKKAKITKFLRQLAHYEGRNTLRDYFGLPFNEEKPCKVIVWVFAPTNRIYDPPNWSPTTKALLDGLTDAKFWTDDNYHVIKSTDFRHGGKSGSKKYRNETEIVLTVWDWGDYDTIYIDNVVNFSAWLQERDVEPIDEETNVWSWLNGLVKKYNEGQEDE